MHQRSLSGVEGADGRVRAKRHAQALALSQFIDALRRTRLRSSDHDGTVLFLTADLDSDSVPDNLDACADTRIPEGVPTPFI